MAVQSADALLNANVGYHCACETPKPEPAPVKVDNNPIYLIVFSSRVQTNFPM